MIITQYVGWGWEVTVQTPPFFKKNIAGVRGRSSPRRGFGGGASKVFPRGLTGYDRCVIQGGYGHPVSVSSSSISISTLRFFSERVTQRRAVLNPGLEISTWYLPGAKGTPGW